MVLSQKQLLYIPVLTVVAVPRLARFGRNDWRFNIEGSEVSLAFCVSRAVCLRSRISSSGLIGCCEAIRTVVPAGLPVAAIAAWSTRESNNVCQIIGVVESMVLKYQNFLCRNISVTLLKAHCYLTVLEKKVPVGNIVCIPALYSL